MSEADRRRWNRRYGASAGPSWRPAAYLVEAEPLLLARLAEVAREGGAQPPVGYRASALDVACGRGRNAIHLASLGYAVTAVDISDLALRVLAAEARRRSLPVEVVQADLDGFRPDPAAFDVVVVVNFLDRRLWASLAAALRPGGLLLAETYTVDRSFPPGSRVSRTYLLERGELAGGFPGLQTLVYREEAGVATLLARAGRGGSGRRPGAGRPFPEPRAEV